MEEVLKGKEAGGHLILVTRESSALMSETEESLVSSLVSSHGVRVSSVVVAGTGARNRFLDTLAARAGGISRRVAADNNNTLEMYTDLVEALRDTIATDSKVSTKRTFHITHIYSRKEVQR